MSILTYPSESLLLDPGWEDAVLAQRPTAFYRLGEPTGQILVPAVGGGGGAGNVVIDDTGTQPLNCCLNPSFENDFTGWWNQPGGVGMNVGSTISLTTVSPQVGAQCAQVVGGGSTVGNGIQYKLDPTRVPGGALIAGQTYSVSVYLRGAAGGEQLYLYFGTNLVGQIVGGGGDLTTVSLPNLTTGWVRYTATWTCKITTSVNALFLCLVLRAAVVSTFFVDGVMITQGNGALGPYYEGTGGTPGQYVGATCQNIVVDPSFETDTVGAAPNAAWLASGVPNQVAGSTLTVQTGAGTPSTPLQGTKALQVVTPAAVQAGVGQNFLAYTFALNIPYTFSFYAKGNVGGESLRLLFGASTDIAQANITLTTSWVRYSVTWMPTANRVNNGWILIYNNTATINTYFIDGVQVTATVAPTIYGDGQPILLANDGVPSLAPNKGMVLDGANQGYAYVANNPTNALYTGTICAWIKTSLNSTAFGTIMGKQGAYIMSVSQGRFQAYNYTTSTYLDSGVTVADGKWHFVCMSFQSGVPSGTILYVDGVQAGPAFTDTFVSNSINNTLIIGNGNMAAAQCFNGTIDEVMVFNYVLPPHEIANMYAASAVGGSGVDLASGSNGFLLRSIDTPSPPRKRVTASTQDTEGSVPVESQYDDRTITIVTRALPSPDRSTWYGKLDRLFQKIGKLNAEGGVLSRNVIGSEFAYFYDITDAQADIEWDNVRYALRMDSDITLTLIARPLIRGSEIPLTLHTEATLPSVQFVETGIRGDVPATGRLVVTEVQAAATQLAVVWGLRSRYQDSSASAALFYECETMTVQDAAVTFALAGASGAGNNTIRHPSLPATTWTPVLMTDRSTVKMTHKGTYRVLLRCYSASNPQIRLIWGMGDLVSTIINPPVTFPNAGGFGLIDLGLIRLATSPQWTGVVQAYGPGTSGGDYLACDCMFLIPVDECAGEIDSLVRVQSPLGITAGPKWWPATGADNAGVGTVAWNNPTSVQAAGVSPRANISLTAGQISHYLMCTGYRDEKGGVFAIPAGATISGITVTASHYCVNGLVIDSSVRLIKAGAVVGTSKPNLASAWATYYGVIPVYGSATDLWGTTLLPADVNASNFGVALSITATGTDTAYVDWINLAISYTTAGGYLDTQDAVLFPLQSCQISDHDVQRENAAGTFMVPAPRYQGDYLRIPPAGIEQRSVGFIIKASRGRINDADSAIDDISAQLFYTPRFLQMPDQ